MTATDFIRALEHDYRFVRVGSDLIAAGLVDEGRRMRDLARRIIQRKRREWWRFERGLRAELGYRDLGGEA